MLINIKKNLNKNPFEIHDTFGITPVILGNYDFFVQKNEEYVETILEFEGYFSELKEVETNEKSEWNIIFLVASILFITFILIKIGAFLTTL